MESTENRGLHYVLRQRRSGPVAVIKYGDDAWAMEFSGADAEQRAIRLIEATAKHKS